MSPSDKSKKKNDVPVIPCINRKRKVVGESFDVVAQKIQKPIKESAAEKPQL